MKTGPSTFLIAAAFLSLLACRAIGQQPGAENASGHAQDTHELRLLTSYLMEAEMGLFARNIPGHVLRSHRHIHMRALEYAGWFLDFSYEEELLYNPGLAQIDHTFDYLRIGRNFRYFDAFFFWNHTCNNPIHDVGINRIRWNDLGIELTTDSRPDAKRTERLHLAARAGPTAMLFENQYLWTARASARINAFDGEGGAAYASLDLDFLIDAHRATLCPIAEAGLTVPITKTLALEPFVRLERRRDAMGYLEKTDTWLLVGLKILQRKDSSTAAQWPSGRPESSWLQILGGYRAILRKTDLGYQSSVTFRFVTPGLVHDGFGEFEVNTGIRTPPNDMYPNGVVFSLGPTVAAPIRGSMWKLSYRFRERVPVGPGEWGIDKRFYHAVTVDFSPLERPAPLKETGFYRDGFNWDLNWTLYPYSYEFDYRVSSGGRVGVRLWNFDTAGIFLGAEAAHFVRDGMATDTGAALELSTVFRGSTGDFRIYLRAESAIDPLNTGKRTYTSFGFDFLFS